MPASGRGACLVLLKSLLAVQLGVIVFVWLGSLFFFSEDFYALLLSLYLLRLGLSLRSLPVLVGLPPCLPLVQSLSRLAKILALFCWVHPLFFLRLVSLLLLVSSSSSACFPAWILQCPCQLLMDSPSAFAAVLLVVVPSPTFAGVALLPLLSLLAASSIVPACFCWGSCLLLPRFVPAIALALACFCEGPACFFW